MQNNIEIVEKEIIKISDKGYSEFVKNFFKTEKGGYSENDIFIGVRVPQLRLVAKKFYKNLSLSELVFFMTNGVHEYRLFAIFCLLLKYKNSKKEIIDFYLKYIDYVNNWDLVDSSAPKLLGDFYFDTPDSLLILANSGSLWKERISIVATLNFIKLGNFDYSLKLAKKFLTHKHDLIHKAVGWVLREVGKKNINLLYKFLDKNISDIPRTTLRYAIERFDKDKKYYYMHLDKPV